MELLLYKIKETIEKKTKEDIADGISQNIGEELKSVAIEISNHSDKLIANPKDNSKDFLRALSGTIFGLLCLYFNQGGDISSLKTDLQNCETELENF